jgi:hypothetical protein
LVFLVVGAKLPGPYYSRVWPNPDLVIDGLQEPLLASEIFSRDLRGALPQLKLHLFYFSARVVARSHAFCQPSQERQVACLKEFRQVRFVISLIFERAWQL